MENLFWEVEFDGTAKKNGVLKVSIIFVTDVNPPGIRSVTVPVQILSGMTPEQKAQATVNAIRAGFPANFFQFEFSPPDDDFKIKVRNPGPNERAIYDLTVSDPGTGEDIEAVRDDPGVEELLMIGFFSIGGRGEDPKGVARLQIGKEYPLVNVRTFRKTGTAINWS